MINQKENTAKCCQQVRLHVEKKFTQGQKVKCQWNIAYLTYDFNKNIHCNYWKETWEIQKSKVEPGLPFNIYWPCAYISNDLLKGNLHVSYLNETSEIGIFQQNQGTYSRTEKVVKSAIELSFPFMVISIAVLHITFTVNSE